MAVGRLRLGSGPRAWLWGESAALTLLAAGGIGVQIAGARQVISMLVSESLLGQSTWFALGMALAVASVVSERSERQSRARRAVVAHSGLCWIGAAASLIGLALVLQPDGLLGVAQALGEKQSITRTLAGIAMTATLIGLLVVPAVFGEGSGGFPRRLLGWAPLAWLGLISYGIYLWHLTVTQLLAFPADPQHFSASGLELATKIEQATTPILLALTIAITSVLAAISYYVVELPFLRRKER
jgi:peptidoglycan/LPS O-acetylase OafA/YrhL